MYVASNHTNANAVSLKELISQLESLKLLVCHTPFPLQLNALPSCVNLVKLDLSRNNIQSFPHLGHLVHLRLIFIHENLLNLKHFTNIFQKEGASSILSNNIVWITFWGNKDSFLARHFAINRTNAIAFDRNLIAEEQKHPSISQFEGFNKNTDISHLLYTKNFLRTYTSQEEYMQDFWSQLRELRKMYESLYPIIKIQRVFRGWIFRQKVKRQVNMHKDSYYTMFNCLKQWQRVIRSRRKLEIILKQRKRGYLLFLQGKIDRKTIQGRMKELAKQAKKRIIKKRLILNNEMKFYAILRSNYLLLQDLYLDLQLQQSRAIYVHQDSLQQFISYVVPFVAKFTNQSIEIAHNLCYHLHYLHNPNACRKKYFQFLILMKVNRFSVISYSKPMQNMLKIMKFKKPTVTQNKMKAIFGRYHISKQKKQQLQQNERKLEQIKRKQRNQLIRIQGSLFLLKTMTRGVYFYNANRLPNVSGQSRLVMFSQRSVKKISAAVSIQRAWKGYIYRKKHNDQLAIVLKIQKAATIIQRWFRRFHFMRKQYFKFYIRGKMSEVKGLTLNVLLSDYMEQIQKNKSSKHRKQLFLQKHSQVIFNPSKNCLCLGWQKQSQNNKIYEYELIRKPPFGQDFYKRYLHFSEQQTKNRQLSFNKENITYQFSHLFHFRTQVSIVTTGNKKYLQVKCSTLEEAKFRMFAISLFSFNFKRRKGMDFYNNCDFSKDCSIISKNKILKQQMVFISNENIKMIKNIEDNCRNIENVKVFIVDNKIFIKVEETKKPLKVDERFIVYLINYENKQQIVKNQQIKIDLKDERRTDNSRKIKYNRFEFSDKKDETQKLSVSSNVDLVNRLRENKIIVKKRSMKQFKSKKARVIERLPHFIIDNKQTQSESRKQQQLLYSSNTKSQVRRKQSQYKIMPTVREFTTKQQTKIQRYQSNIQKINTQKKQTNNFIQKFVNLGNFLQNQLLSQQRRKIKTEIQESAHDIFENIRRSQHKYSKDKQQKTFQRYKRAREMQEQHKSLLEKNKLQASQHIQALRSNVTDIKSSIKRNKSNIRPKIIFAQQRFPIILKKHDNFSTK